MDSRSALHGKEIPIQRSTLPARLRLQISPRSRPYRTAASSAFKKVHGLDQIARSGVRVETLGDDFDAGPGAFLDTAAVMANLDLIVTVDTSIAHLAGAMARPVWVALKHMPEWRWMLGRNDFPWYPTMRLFRQRSMGDWEGVFADVADALKSLIAEKAKGSTGPLLSRRRSEN